MWGKVSHILPWISNHYVLLYCIYYSNMYITIYVSIKRIAQLCWLWILHFTHWLINIRHLCLESSERIITIDIEYVESPNHSLWSWWKCNNNNMQIVNFPLIWRSSSPCNESIDIFLMEIYEWYVSSINHETSE